jgi:flagellar biosynthesis/type III secretory pathway chaperone
METVETVRALLEREREVCTALAGVLEAEREALTSFSVAALARCVRDKDALHGEFVALVHRRRATVRLLAGELGLERDDGRVLPLLPHLPETVAARLRDTMSALRTSLLATRRLQRVNGALIDASLARVGDLLRVCRQALPGARYDRQATVTPGPAPDAIDQRV